MQPITFFGNFNFLSLAFLKYLTCKRLISEKKLKRSRSSCDLLTKWRSPIAIDDRKIADQSCLVSKKGTRLFLFYFKKTPSLLSEILFLCSERKQRPHRKIRQNFSFKFSAEEISLTYPNSSQEGQLFQKLNSNHKYFFLIF